jgi:hypothetical protein
MSYVVKLTESVVNVMENIVLPPVRYSGLIRNNTATKV